MTKKELKEIIYALCEVLDAFPTESEEYKKASKDLQKIQEQLWKTIAVQKNKQID